MYQRLQSIHFVLLALLLTFPLCATLEGSAAEITLKGTVKFKTAVFLALELLRTNSPEAFQIVTNYISVIEQGKHSGMWAYRNPPMLELADPTTFYSVTWCAGSIAHDSLHSKLYFEYKQQHGSNVPANAWIGSESEQKCLAHQLAVLQRIGAPANEVEHCRRQTGEHADVNKDGKYDWKDYRERKW